MDGFSPLDIVETIRTPVLVLDPDLRVAFANRAFYQVFHVREAETHGRLIYDLGDGQWDIARLRELLHDVIPKNSVVEDFRVETASQLYDLIARSETAEAVRGDTYLSEIAATLTASLLGEVSGIAVAVEAEPLALHKDASVPIGLIVNELATNAIKHAFPSGKGDIRIGLTRQADDIVRLSVTDDGIGLNASAGTKGTGFGSRYVSVFVRQLDGTLSQSSGPAGSSFDIRLPASVLAG